jgi:EAL domain-containing protein (putative c-di-GMP-specific phosphodiesterase class I)/ActR/RegA family two-component response regulator
MAAPNPLLWEPEEEHAMSGSGATQSVLIIDDDLMMKEGLAACLERAGRTLITCSDLAAAEMIEKRLRPSHIVTDVRLTGLFAYEGLDLLPFVREHSPETRVILMSGDHSEALAKEATARGAVAFFGKPFEVSDLAAALDSTSTPDVAMAMSGACDDGRVERVPLLDEIIASPELMPFFQPIVALRGRREAIGFESLARFRSDSLFRAPDLLFQYAARKNRVVDLELACIEATAVGAAALPGSPSVFMNLHPDVFRAPGKLVETLQRSASTSGLALDRVVLEITEQASLPSSPDVFTAIAALRALGARFAFDDVGVAYSHLPLIDSIRPSFLKISQEFGMNFETDPTRTKIVRNILSLAQAFACDVILEGIESESTAAAAETLGIRYGQGYYFGRPASYTIRTTTN